MASKRARIFWRVYARTMGIGLLVLVAPCLVLRAACAPYSAICESVGGEYVELADVSHVCQMPSESAPCPAPFERQEPGVCVVSSVTGLACRASTLGLGSGDHGE